MEPSQTQPTPLNPAPSSLDKHALSSGVTPPRKKRRPNFLQNKLTGEKLTSMNAISSIVSVGRATAEEFANIEDYKGKHAKIMGTIIRRAIRWARTIAPHQTPAQFAVEARTLSGKRKVKAYLSDVRLAQLRGADFDGESDEDPADIDINMKNESTHAKNQMSDPASNAITVDAPDIDDVMEDQIKAAPEPPEPFEDNEWDEPDDDLFMDDVPTETTEITKSKGGDADPNLNKPALSSNEVAQDLAENGKRTKKQRESVGGVKAVNIGAKNESTGGADLRKEETKSVGTKDGVTESGKDNEQLKATKRGDLHQNKGKSDKNDYGSNNDKEKLEDSSAGQDATGNHGVNDPNKAGDSTPVTGKVNEEDDNEDDEDDEDGTVIRRKAVRSTGMQKDVITESASQHSHLNESPVS